MAETVKPVPDGYETLMAYIVVKGADKAIDFYKRAFGAEERVRMPAPDGSIGHAEIAIRNSILMLADEPPDGQHPSAQTLGGTPFSFVLYVEDADGTFNRAVEAGAKVLQPVSNRFYGDRAGSVADPFGFHWSIMTHVEDVPPAEMSRRAAEEFAKMSGSDSAGQTESARHEQEEQRRAEASERTAERNEKKIREQQDQ